MRYLPNKNVPPHDGIWSVKEDISLFTNSLDSLDSRIVLVFNRCDFKIGCIVVDSMATESIDFFLKPEFLT